jgi:hypothetical protein
MDKRNGVLEDYRDSIPEVVATVFMIRQDDPANLSG